MGIAHCHLHGQRFALDSEPTLGDVLPAIWQAIRRFCRLPARESRAPSP